jgi:putative transcriptional regulator
MAINCNLSTLMGANRLTIQDVFNATKLSRRTISELYHDKVTRIDYGTLNKLCEFLNCDVQDLIKYTPDIAKEGEANASL